MSSIQIYNVKRLKDSPTLTWSVDIEGNVTGAASGSSGGSTGTVTSVALTTPAELTVAGSPITTSGTLAISWASQAANTFLAAPSGGSGTPSFRTLAVSDFNGGTGASVSTFWRGDGTWAFIPAGTVSSFSAGNLSPLFTTSVANPTTTPALSFTLSNAAGGTVFGNNGGASGAPAYTAAPVLGIAASVNGTLGLANGGGGGAIITIQNPGATAAYNFNLPTTAGTSGFVLTSGGGGSSPMTWISTSSLSGVDASKIQGTTVSSNAPKTGDLFIYNQYGDSKWDVTGGYRFLGQFLEINQGGSVPTWQSVGASTAMANGGTTTSAYATATEGMGIKNATAATATSYAYSAFAVNGLNAGHFTQGAALRRFSWRASHYNSTSCRYWMGLHNNLVAAGTGPGGGSGVDTWTFANAAAVMWRFSTVAGDTHWKAYVGTAAAHTIVDTGISLDSSGTTSHLFELAWDGTAWNFYYDGSLVASISTNVPTAGTTVYGFLAQVDNVATTTTPAFGIQWMTATLR